MVRTHVALYGNVKLLRKYCHRCECYAFVQDGKFACCDRPTSENVIARAKGMVAPVFVRKQPKASRKKEILAQQNNACAYCDRTFGKYVHVKGKLRQLKCAWDHLVPYAYSANNGSENFVAACQVCNGWKSDHMFPTMEEARLFLAQKWEGALNE